MNNFVDIFDLAFHSSSQLCTKIINAVLIFYKHVLIQVLVATLFGHSQVTSDGESKRRQQASSEKKYESSIKWSRGIDETRIEKASQNGTSRISCEQTTT